MDTDWCLTCGRRQQESSPYCSLQCMMYDAPSTASPRGPDSIHAWAKAIPPGPPPPPPSLPTVPHSTTASTRSSSSSSLHSQSSSSASSSPPRTPASLLTSPSPSYKPKPPHLILHSQIPLPPTLCMSTPQPPPRITSAPKSTPIRAPSAHYTPAPASASSRANGTSASSASPSIATPSAHSALGSLANHVRTWVTPSAPASPSSPHYTPACCLEPHPEDAKSHPNSNETQHTLRLPKSPTSPSQPSHPSHAALKTSPPYYPSRATRPRGNSFSPFPTSLRGCAWDDDELSSTLSSACDDGSRNSYGHPSPQQQQQQQQHPSPPRGIPFARAPQDHFAPQPQLRGRKASRALA